MSMHALSAAKRSRWMNWTPKARISEDSAESVPTKPSKPGFVGFDGATSAESSEIRPDPDRQRIRGPQILGSDSAKQTKDTKEGYALPKASNPELLGALQRCEATTEELAQLEVSMRRLESVGICVAIWDTGAMRVVMSEAHTLQAIDGDATIYTPADMLMYVTLSERKRKILHDFKKRFGGTTEWKQPEKA